MNDVVILIGFEMTTRITIEEIRMKWKFSLGAKEHLSRAQEKVNGTCACKCITILS